MRRTDFPPVGGEADEEVLDRGYDSLSDSDEEGRGLEYACEGDSDIYENGVSIAENNAHRAKSELNDYE